MEPSVSFTESRTQAMMKMFHAKHAYRITKTYHSTGELGLVKKIHPGWEFVPVGARRIAHVAGRRCLDGTERREVGAECHWGKKTLRLGFWNRQLQED